jgi:hypothetical protein
MQKQCHIILYIPDYHVNIHRVCSTAGIYEVAALNYIKSEERTYIIHLLSFETILPMQLSP